MYKQAFSALLLAGGLALALGSASCGTCPAGQQSCGNSNPGANAAGAASTDAATCKLLTAFRSCMTDFCKTTSNPFCTCYKRGFNLSVSSCQCIDFDTEAYCDQAKSGAVDADSYDCAADSSRISTICVPVQ